MAGLVTSLTAVATEAFGPSTMAACRSRWWTSNSAGTCSTIPRQKVGSRQPESSSSVGAVRRSRPVGQHHARSDNRATRSVRLWGAVEGDLAELGYSEFRNRRHGGQSSDPGRSDMTETEEVDRPAPILTDDNHFFWDAARDGRLMGQRCEGCGRLRHPPRPMCPHCHSLRFRDDEPVGCRRACTATPFSIIHKIPLSSIRSSPP